MKKIIFAFCFMLICNSSLFAIKLSEIMVTHSVGKNIGQWKASHFVPEHLVGKNFGVSSKPRKVWQLRFFTFEDRQNALEKKIVLLSLLKNLASKVWRVKRIKCPIMMEPFIGLPIWMQMNF